VASPILPLPVVVALTFFPRLLPSLPPITRTFFFSHKRVPPAGVTRLWRNRSAPSTPLLPLWRCPVPHVLRHLNASSIRPLPSRCLLEPPNPVPRDPRPLVLYPSPRHHPSALAPIVASPVLLSTSSFPTSRPQIHPMLTAASALPSPSRPHQPSVMSMPALPFPRLAPQLLVPKPPTPRHAYCCLIPSSTLPNAVLPTPSCTPMPVHTPSSQPQRYPLLHKSRITDFFFWFLCASVSPYQYHFACPCTTSFVYGQCSMSYSLCTRVSIISQSLPSLLLLPLIDPLCCTPPAFSRASPLSPFEPVVFCLRPVKFLSIRYFGCTCESHAYLCELTVQECDRLQNSMHL
jgi:hypothetical protein